MPIRSGIKALTQKCVCVAFAFWFTVHLRAQVRKFWFFSSLIHFTFSAESCDSKPNDDHVGVSTKIFLLFFSFEYI